MEISNRHSASTNYRSDFADKGTNAHQVFANLYANTPRHQLTPQINNLLPSILQSLSSEPFLQRNEQSSAMISLPASYANTIQPLTDSFTLATVNQFGIVFNNPKQSDYPTQADRNFIDGAKEGISATGADLLESGKLAYQLATNSSERAKFANAIESVVDALQDPARRIPTLRSIGQELGQDVIDAFLNFSNDPDYYAGYLAGNIALGGFGKLAKVAATAGKLNHIVDKADKVAGEAWNKAKDTAIEARDFAQRVEIKQNGLGSNGANVDVKIRPKVPSYVHGQSDGGPGAWEKAVTPQKGAEYQKLVTGAPTHTEYLVKTPYMESGVKKFDGYDPQRNTLIDAKDWSIGKKGWPPSDEKPWGLKPIQEMLNDAEDQIKISQDVGIPVEWHFPTKEKRDEIATLFLANDIAGIKLLVTTK